MERLDFKLDEFVRVSWVSGEARDVWAPIFSNLSNVFRRVEQAMVTLSTFGRKVALLNCSPSELITLARDASRNNLVVIPIVQQASFDHYQSAGAPFDPEKRWEYKVVLGPPKDAQDFIDYYMTADWNRVGEMLGYPPCCRKFFERFWVQEKWFDTTFPMVSQYGPDYQTDFPDFFAENNILLRWVGLRAVSHLPCSFNCGHTYNVATNYERVAHLLGLKKEWTQLLDILSWPVEWTSLHGIAQIVTPVCKITTASDALSHKAEIRLHSNNRPKEAGRGNAFPFTKDTWTDNGFSTASAMAVAHLRIIDTLVPLLFTCVVDLGCGNGELLRKIKARFGSLTLGVDSDRAKKPDLVSDLYDFDFAPSAWAGEMVVALVAIQRRQEQPEKFNRLLQRLKDKNVTVIAYDHSTGTTMSL